MRLRKSLRLLTNSVHEHHEAVHFRPAREAQCANRYGAHGNAEIVRGRFDSPHLSRARAISEPAQKIRKLPLPHGFSIALYQSRVDRTTPTRPGSPDRSMALRNNLTLQQRRDLLRDDAAPHSR